MVKSKTNESHTAGKQTAVYPKKMIDRRYRARAGPVETGRARVCVDEACVLTMMRPSMTVSVFS
jgi:hypothetical protein